MKHCNRAHVWGILDKFEDKTTDPGGKPYLEVYIDCRHDLHGNVRVLGFIWGKANVADFKANFSRGDEIRFSGSIQQYDGRNKVTRTTFNLYILKPGPIKEHKATFIIVGEVISLEGETFELLIKSEYRSGVQKGNRSGVSPDTDKNVGANSRSPVDDAVHKEDTFKVHLPGAVLLEAEQTPEPGQIVSVKGYIMHPEDEFGEPTGPQQPVIKELKFL